MVRKSNSQSQSLQERKSNRGHLRRNQALGLFLVLCGLLLAPLSQAAVVDRVIAVIGDQVVLQSDLEEFRKNLRSGGLVDDLLMSTVNQKELMKSDKQLIDFLVNQNIVDQEVKRKDLQVTIERVEQEIRMVSQNNGMNRAQLKTMLQNKGVTFAEYQDFMKKTLERHSLIKQDVLSRIAISDEEVAAQFAKKTGRSQVYEYKLANIVFLNKSGGANATKERAERVLALISQGQSFDKLAKQYSEDPHFVEGGVLGSFRAQELNKELAAAVQGLGDGDVSNLVQTKNGYSILKVIDRKLVEDPQLKTQKNVIYNELMTAAIRTQLTSWLAQKRTEYFIRIN